MRQKDIHTGAEILAAAALEADRGEIRLNEAEVYSLLGDSGLDVCAHEFLPVDAGAAERTAWAQRAAALADGRGRVLLKIVGRTILHKSDVGGVRVLRLGDGDGPEPVAGAAAGMLETVAANVADGAIEGLLAAAFVPHEANRPGQEILLSLRQDPAFGPVVVVGVGGLLTEWYGKATGGASRLIFPAAGLDPELVAAALEAHPLLSIFCRPSRLHAEPPIASAEFAGAVAALARMATDWSADSGTETLEELEINPAVVSDGRLVAIDGVGLVSRRRLPEADRPLGKISNLLRPGSAAVIGVSARGANAGRVIMQNLRDTPGVSDEHLHLVHPKETAIDGVACVPDVASLPEKVDLAVVCIPAGGARDAIADLVEHDKAASIILIPGGFAEAGQGDLAAEIEDLLIAGHRGPGGGPVLVGGNCLGIVSRDHYNTFFLPQYKLPFSPALSGGNLALVSQSGAYLVTFSSNYDGVIHPRASISFGNQMDLTVADFLLHFLDDDEVDVFACYVEGFRPGDGERFLAATREARARGKTVIIYKAGRTTLGAKAAASHTASLAGDYDVARDCLTAAGALVTEDLGDFEDLIKTFTMLAGKDVGGRRVGILSNAGFECTASTDSLGKLEPAPFDDATRAELDACLPSFAHRDNPVDTTPMADTEAFARSAAAILACPAVDCAIISSVPVTQALNNLPAAADGAHREDLSHPDSQPARLAGILGPAGKPAVVVIDSGPLYDPMVEMMEERGVPVFRKIDQAARIFGRFVEARLGA